MALKLLHKILFHVLLASGWNSEELGLVPVCEVCGEQLVRMGDTDQPLADGH